MRVQGRESTPSTRHMSSAPTDQWSSTYHSAFATPARSNQMVRSPLSLHWHSTPTTLDFQITSTGALSSAVRALGYCRFAEVAEAVRALPYSRVRDTEELLAALDEQKGTCSSKHRFLAALAHECGYTDVKLTLGLYEMSERNTPGVGGVLEAAGKTRETAAEEIAFARQHGVVLASAKGAVPRLPEAIAGEPIKGSWWAHPNSHHIFAILQAVTDSEDILVCRLVDGKLTLVHRRLWPALVRVADRFSATRIAKVREEHTPSGHHVSREVPFPKWV